jgi:NAD-dependent dihydropyrimidine dehydrogenase PreA subunit|tara:strand:+ start:1397 stop:1651 length:255 start_codon:yes stop_codon:yes gene_type:complete
MSYIIGSKCIDVKDGACIDVCPVDCIHEMVTQMVIHPEECIDCGACIPACPVEAIWEDEDEAKSMGDEKSIEINYKHFGLEFEG